MVPPSNRCDQYETRFIRSCQPRSPLGGGNIFRGRSLLTPIAVRSLRQGLRYRMSHKANYPNYHTATVICQLGHRVSRDTQIRAGASPSSISSHHCSAQQCTPHGLRTAESHPVRWLSGATPTEACIEAASSCADIPHKSCTQRSLGESRLKLFGGLMSESTRQPGIGIEDFRVLNGCFPARCCSPRPERVADAPQRPPRPAPHRIPWHCADESDGRSEDAARAQPGERCSPLLRSS